MQISLTQAAGLRAVGLVGFRAACDHVGSVNGFCKVWEVIYKDVSACGFECRVSDPCSVLGLRIRAFLAGSNFKMCQGVHNLGAQQSDSEAVVSIIRDPCPDPEL